MKRSVSSFINYIKFAYFLTRDIFGSNSPEVILRVINKFVSLEAPFYSDKIVKSRSMSKSIALLNSLTTSYIETKSSVTLDQIFIVLKEEFLKREGNQYGGKQF